MWSNCPISYTQAGQLPRYDPIQAAQERDELQRKGDEYDNKIRKAEKEIRYALFNCTLYSVHLHVSISIMQGFGEHSSGHEWQK